MSQLQIQYEWIPSLTYNPFDSNSNLEESEGPSHCPPPTKFYMDLNALEMHPNAPPIENFAP